MVRNRRCTLQNLCASEHSRHCTENSERHLRFFYKHYVLKTLCPECQLFDLLFVRSQIQTQPVIEVLKLLILLFLAVPDELQIAFLPGW